jgi:amino acid permease
MFSRKKSTDIEDIEQREQYQYARARIKQKKRLMQHFIVFLGGSIIAIILDLIMGIGDEFFIKHWFAWFILIWAFILLIHFFNVFILNRFMGKEWEDRQLEMLKAKQEKRILKLQQKVEKEMPLPESKKKESDQLNQEGDL